MKLVRPPYPVRKLYSGLLWRIPTDEKKIFLTFDDGPVPTITPWVLDVLRSFGAKATFFCVGENIEKHPELYRQVIQEGHAVGNHTYNHLRGSRTPNNVYLDNIEKCSRIMDKGFPQQNEGRLFRPPYGRIRKSQIKHILSDDIYSESKVKSQKSKIVMWDVLSYDFDRSVSPEMCLNNVMKFCREGSIVVFHDSVKAQRNLEFVLPKMLNRFTEKGFKFDAIMIPFTQKYRTLDV
jgi:peptidoglycan/xylan/chitin deacetylase (PgdA/CDA1 family)